MTNRAIFVPIADSAGYAAAQIDIVFTYLESFEASGTVPPALTISVDGRFQPLIAARATRSNFACTVLPYQRGAYPFNNADHPSTDSTNNDQLAFLDQQASGVADAAVLTPNELARSLRAIDREYYAYTATAGGILLLNRRTAWAQGLGQAVLEAHRQHLRPQRQRRGWRQGCQTQQ